jgi:hypothetical protein
MLGSINNKVSDINLVFKIKIFKWFIDVSFFLYLSEYSCIVKASFIVETPVISSNRNANEN